jgi:hypothetical protein
MAYELQSTFREAEDYLRRISEYQDIYNRIYPKETPLDLFSSPVLDEEKMMEHTGSFIARLKARKDAGKTEEEADLMSRAMEIRQRYGYEDEVNAVTVSSVDPSKPRKRPSVGSVLSDPNITAALYHRYQQTLYQSAFPVLFRDGVTYAVAGPEGDLEAAKVYPLFPRGAAQAQQYEDDLFAGIVLGMVQQKLWNPEAQDWAPNAEVVFDLLNNLDLDLGVGALMEVIAPTHTQYNDAAGNVLLLGGVHGNLRAANGQLYEVTATKDMTAESAGESYILTVTDRRGASTRGSMEMEPDGSEATISGSVAKLLAGSGKADSSDQVRMVRSSYTNYGDAAKPEDRKVELFLTSVSNGQRLVGRVRILGHTYHTEGRRNPNGYAFAFDLAGEQAWLILPSDKGPAKFMLPDRQKTYELQTYASGIPAMFRVQTGPDMPQRGVTIPKILGMLSRGVDRIVEIIKAYDIGTGNAEEKAKIEAALRAIRQGTLASRSHATPVLPSGPKGRSAPVPADKEPPPPPNVIMIMEAVDKAGWAVPEGRATLLRQFGVMKVRLSRLTILGDEEALDVQRLYGDSKILRGIAALRRRRRREMSSWKLGMVLPSFKWMLAQARKNDPDYATRKDDFEWLIENLTLGKALEAEDEEALVQHLDKVRNLGREMGSPPLGFPIVTTELPNMEKQLTPVCSMVLTLWGPSGQSRKSTFVYTLPEEGQKALPVQTVHGSSSGLGDEVRFITDVESDSLSPVYPIGMDGPNDLVYRNFAEAYRNFAGGTKRPESKLEILYTLITQKFSVGSAFARQLRQTSPKKLIYLNPNDLFLGVDAKGVGENHLGRALEAWRDTLIESEAATAPGLVATFEEADPILGALGFEELAVENSARRRRGRLPPFSARRNTEEKTKKADTVAVTLEEYRPLLQRVLTREEILEAVVAAKEEMDELYGDQNGSGFNPMAALRYWFLNQAGLINAIKGMPEDYQPFLPYNITVAVLVDMSLMTLYKEDKARGKKLQAPLPLGRGMCEGEEINLGAYFSYIPIPKTPKAPLRPDIEEMSLLYDSLVQFPIYHRFVPATVPLEDRENVLRTALYTDWRFPPGQFTPILDLVAVVKPAYAEELREKYNIFSFPKVSRTDAFVNAFQTLQAVEDAKEEEGTEKKKKKSDDTEKDTTKESKLLAQAYRKVMVRGLMPSGMGGGSDAEAVARGQAMAYEAYGGTRGRLKRSGGQLVAPDLSRLVRGVFKPVRNRKTIFDFIREMMRETSFSATLAGSRRKGFTGETRRVWEANLPARLDRPVDIREEGQAPNPVLAELEEYGISLEDPNNPEQVLEALQKLYETMKIEYDQKVLVPLLDEDQTPPEVTSFMRKLAQTNPRRAPRPARKSRRSQQNPLDPETMQRVYEYAGQKNKTTVAKELEEGIDQNRSAVVGTAIGKQSLDALFPQRASNKAEWVPKDRLAKLAELDVVGRGRRVLDSPEAGSARTYTTEARYRQAESPFAEGVFVDALRDASLLSLEDAVSMMQAQGETLRRAKTSKGQDFRRAIQPSSALCKLYRSRRLTGYELPPEMSGSPPEGGHPFSEALILMSPTDFKQARVMTWRRGVHLDCDMVGEASEMVDILGRAVLSMLYWLVERRGREEDPTKPQRGRNSLTVYVGRVGSPYLYVAYRPGEPMTIAQVTGNLAEAGTGRDASMGKIDLFNIANPEKRTKAVSAFYQRETDRYARALAAIRKASTERWPSEPEGPRGGVQEEVREEVQPPPSSFVPPPSEPSVGPPTFTPPEPPAMPPEPPATPTGTSRAIPRTELYDPEADY